MAEPSKKKKVIVTKSKSAEKLKPAGSIRGKSNSTTDNSPTELVFGKDNFKFMLLGIGLIALGLVLMMGGHMPDDNTWDDGLIYSTRRTLIAPILILAGLIMQFFAIFRK